MKRNQLNKRTSSSQISGSSKRSKKNTQADMFPKEKSNCGGVLRNTRQGRQGARKLTTKYTMHLVLRSSKAKNEWSFTKPKNRSRIREVILKHARRNHILIQSVANVGNHLHLHIKLQYRESYKAFIRAITGAIAILVMGASRLNVKVKSHKDRFWDYRPFTSFVDTFRHFLNMKDYMRINQLEGIGYSRANARMLLAYEYDRKVKAKHRKANSTW